VSLRATAFGLQSGRFEELEGLTVGRVSVEAKVRRLNIWGWIVNISKTILGCAALLGVLLAEQAKSHHAVSAHFDRTRTIELRGEVVDFKLRSPHSSFVVDGQVFVDGESHSSEIERWEVESQSLALLRRLGVNQDSFQPGDYITLFASPNRNPDFRFVFSDDFVTAGGQRIAGLRTLRDEIPTGEDALRLRQATGIERLAGRWSIPGRIFEDDTPLPLNEAGRAAWREYDPKLSPANTCETISVPSIYNSPYLFDIRVEGETVVLHNQVYDVIRTVPIDGTTSATPEGLFGIVSGRIEGDALIVESSGYPPSKWGLGIATQINGGGADVPSSDQKVLTERFFASEDGLSLLYQYTMEDPVNMSGPFSDESVFARIADDDTPMDPYECDLESAAMFSREPGDEVLRIGDE